MQSARYDYNHVANLLVWAQSLRCAFPLAHVVETMRPLPVRPIRDCPSYVAGLAIIRGQPAPVVDLGCLLTGKLWVEPAPRWVTLRSDQYVFAIAVDSVIGVREISQEGLAKMPALLRGTGGSSVVSHLAAIDQKVFMLLDAAHVVPADVWGALAQESVHS